MDFLIVLPQSADCRDDSYNLILVIVNRLTKMVYYEHVQTTITILALAKVIFNIIFRYYGLPNPITSNYGSVFTFKFESSLFYFLSIKQRLFTIFHPQSNSRTKQRNSTMKAYFRVFINYKCDNWARLLLMVEFVYNNTKHANIRYTSFKLNYGYYPSFLIKKMLTPTLGLKQLIS